MRSELNVVEIFLSIQGEGFHQGRQVVFIRLAGCNLTCSFCDTDYSKGKLMTIEQIIDTVSILPWRKGYTPINIVWTGGEPCLQLTSEHTEVIRKQGWWQAIETNGTMQIPANLNHISISPKGELSDEVFYRYEGRGEKPTVELRFPIQSQGDTYIPDTIKYLQYIRSQRIKCLKQRILPYIYVSPVFNDDGTCNKINLKCCLQIIQESPEILLSLQLHKLIGLP